MSTLITLSTTTGTLPLNVWICDSCDTPTICIYYDTVYTLPYSFTLPQQYENNVTYGIKVVDNNGCVYCETPTSSNKQFEDGDSFEFQDGETFEFQ